MKKIITIILLGMSLFVGCENIYRDELAQIHKEIDDINARLDAFCNETNTNIAALQTMIAALQAKDYVTGVVPVMEDGKEVGYQITFDKSGKVTIYHGKDGANGADGANGKDGKDGYTPQIGVKLHTDGLYYWTLDGEWLTDENGNMIKAIGVDGEDGEDGKDGAVGPQGPEGPQGPQGEQGDQGPAGADGKDAIAPKLKIEDGNWYVSVDGGVTWDYLGQATGDAGQDGATGPQGPQGEQGPQGDKGDSIFSDIDITEEYVIITLADGKTQIILPTWAAFNALKTQVDKLNADMQALQALVAAWEANDYVKSVTPLPDGSGYVLTFVHSGAVTIYHGKDGADGSNGADGKDGHTPVISVKKDTDGIWYWTIDGEWLLDEAGNKVVAVGRDGQDGANGADGSNGIDGAPGQDGEDGKDGVTPRFKIENGMWYVSYDDGQTWELAGQATGNQGGSGEAGDSMFAAVDSSNPDYIVIALTDGRVLKFPTWSAFEALKAMCNEMNTNISSLQSIVIALQNNDYVTGVTEITDNGKVIGYTIHFSKSAPAVIYHGKDGAQGAPGQDGTDGKDGYVPNIGLKQDTDGVWYWTLDGEWMLDGNGQKVKASAKDGVNGSNGIDGNPGTPGQDGSDGKDGISPKLKIENGNWYVSYDNGTTWEYLAPATGDKGDIGETGPTGPQGPEGPQGPAGEDGKDGDSMFSDIEITAEYIIITLADGVTKIQIPTWKSFSELAAKVELLNADVTAIKALVEAWNQNDYVKSVTPLTDGSGYVLEFVKSGKVTIYHGQDGSDGKDGHSPVVSVRQDTDGVWYWTIDGEWLFDGNGNKVVAVGKDGTPGANGITPKFKIDEGFWYVSYDNGNTWEMAGQATGNTGGAGEAGDSLFAAVDSSNEDFIVIVLTDGRTLKFPTWAAFEELKTLCNQMNTNLSSLQTLVNSNDYVTGVTEIWDNGEVIGYTISFTKSKPVVIYHGKNGKDGVDGAPGQDGEDGKDGADGKDGYVPNIGLKQDTDEVWYWTLDGEWMLDSNGQRVKASGKDGADGSNGSNGTNGQDGQNGVTPRLKIENGYWYISYDNGSTWEQIGRATGDKGDIGETGPQGPTGPEGPQGPAGSDGEDGKDGDTLISDIEITNDYVLITLADGQQIQVPTWAAHQALEQKVNQMNTNIEAIQTILTALQNNDYVTGVTKIYDGGKEIGYTINFSKSGSVTIYHGKDGQNGTNGSNGTNGKDGHTPAIAVKQDTDGIWYWTLDGEWLLDSNGNKVKAVGTDGQNGANGSNGSNGTDGVNGKDGITPKFKIEDGMWYVSYDNGQTWENEPLGQATGDQGDSLFTGIDCSNENYIVLTLSNGQVIVLSTWNEESEIDDIVSRIQTVTYMPEYYDGAAYVDRVKEEVELTFKLSSSTVGALENIWERALSVKCINTIVTKATPTMRDLTIKTVKFDNTVGTITVCVDCSDFEDAFYREEVAASVALFISAPNNSVSSDFIPLKLFSLTKYAADIAVEGTANCYIVKEPGIYMFKTVKGNSIEKVGKVYSVDVLWESFGTNITPLKGDLIKVVGYNDGYLAFQTSDDFKEGNAVIAAKDDEGNILWSWHIWMTDEPQEQIYYNSAGTMMDRNLGATSAVLGDVGAIGLLYQWGRKDPFLGSSSISSSVEANSTISWPSAVKSTKLNGTIEYAIANPTTFISYHSDNNDWYYTGSSSIDNSRWTTHDKSKSIYDPCPAGWRVPTGGNYGVWASASGVTTQIYNYPYDNLNKGMNFSGTFGSDPSIWYPASPSRNYNGSLTISNYGGYWAVKALNYTGEVQAPRLSFNGKDDGNGTVYMSESSSRASAYSVRCIKSNR